jgi:hypothetical protein
LKAELGIDFGLKRMYPDLTVQVDRYRSVKGGGDTVGTRDNND